MVGVSHYANLSESLSNVCYPNTTRNKPDWTVASSRSGERVEDHFPEKE